MILVSQNDCIPFPVSLSTGFNSTGIGMYLGSTVTPVFIACASKDY